ncbi:MAG: hypothetical protein KBG84_17005 [Planctomycetes bacterium]|nr:hypothetical protein [Planctomycetota bacterium]
MKTQIITAILTALVLSAAATPVMANQRQGESRAEQEARERQLDLDNKRREHEMDEIERGRDHDNNDRSGADSAQSQSIRYFEDGRQRPDFTCGPSHPREPDEYRPLRDPLEPREPTDDQNWRSERNRPMPCEWTMVPERRVDI